MRGATESCLESLRGGIFQSTLPLRGATARSRYERVVNHISIHAPLAGSDNLYAFFAQINLDFNPRSPCGERLLTGEAKADADRFQSTLPLRGATVAVLEQRVKNLISIHAPLAGSDEAHHILSRTYKNFNPRSPCGERPSPRLQSIYGAIFQSTLPLRGATVGLNQIAQLVRISIHAPLAGSDAVIFHDGQQDFRFQSTLPLRGATERGHEYGRHVLHFNPRSPCGERRGPRQLLAVTVDFNPRSPCGERRGRFSGRRNPRDFNPRSPCGERLGTLRTSTTGANFNPRSPCGERLGGS